MEAPTKGRTWHPRDICVVSTEELACLIEVFLATKGKRSPQNPLVWLYERTRDGDPAGRGISTTRIAKLLRRERVLTELSVADALLVAMGEVEALYDGTITIIPNPGRPGCCRIYQPSGLLFVQRCLN